MKARANNVERKKTRYLLVAFIAMAVGLSITSCDEAEISGAPQDITVAAGWQKPQKLPSPVNSSAWEDGPSISPDGNTLYFTRGKDRDVKTYYSVKKGGKWREPKEIPINIKSFPTGAPHTQDGKTLYFSSVRPGGQGQGDIYVATKSGGKWKFKEQLSPPVNTKEMESEPFISADQKTLYFAATRKGGVGKTDIWMSRKTSDGWGKPVNLGAPVNTRKDETQPFVTADGQKLYFTAVNRDGIPGPAVFSSDRIGGKWQKPKVVVSGFVGEPTLTADQKYLYFVHLELKGGKLVDANIMYTQRQKQK